MQEWVKTCNTTIFFGGGEWMLLTRLTNVFFFLFYVQIIFFKVGLLLVATLNKKCLKITTAAIRELAPPSEKNSADNKKISYVSVSWTIRPASSPSAWRLTSRPSTEAFATFEHDVRAGPPRLEWQSGLAAAEWKALADCHAVSQSTMQIFYPERLFGSLGVREVWVACRKSGHWRLSWCPRDLRSQSLAG